MTDLRKAAEMSIEAIMDGDVKDKAAAVYALRQALAQPEQYDQIALELCDVCGWKAVIPDDGCFICARKNQTPVAIVNEGMGGIEWLSKPLPDDTPLYTAPPKREWKGLTPDDKHFLLANAWNKEQAFDGFMDAIDKFLEEKNK